MKTKINKLGAFTMAASSLIVLSGAHVFAADDIAAGPITANRTTDAQVKFVEDSTKTEPLDPINPDPDKPIKPADSLNLDKAYEEGTGSNGPLSLDYASVLNFGEQKISVKNEVYHASPQLLFKEDGKTIDTENKRPNYAQLTDKRGGEKGWTLSVKQNGQFKSAKNNKELTGAEISFKNGHIVSMSSSKEPSTVKSEFKLNPDGNGAVENVMAASTGEGFGTWTYLFGDLDTMGNSIELSVPGATAKEADTYKTSLTWTMSDVPTNDDKTDEKKDVE